MPNISIVRTKFITGHRITQTRAVELRCAGAICKKKNFQYKFLPTNYFT